MRRWLCLLIACLLLFSGCSFFPKQHHLTVEEARERAVMCFAEHREDMEAIITSGNASGEPKWCAHYLLLDTATGEYEFVLYQSGFTGTNVRTGLLYLPSGAPRGTQDAENPNLYISEGVVQGDIYLLERLEPHWFYFYYRYDF